MTNEELKKHQAELQHDLSQTDKTIEANEHLLKALKEG